MENSTIILFFLIVFIISFVIVLAYMPTNIDVTFKQFAQVVLLMFVIMLVIATILVPIECNPILYTLNKLPRLLN